jgi:Lar family restriction alleviation protein
MVKLNRNENGMNIGSQKAGGSINNITGGNISIGKKKVKDGELKPCPFCGGKANIDRMGTGRVSMQISCEDCGCSLETGETWIDENSSWNQRETNVTNITNNYAPINIDNRD